MISALFPVNREITAGITSADASPALESSLGDEKTDRFARLLHVYTGTDGTGSEKEGADKENFFFGASSLRVPRETFLLSPEGKNSEGEEDLGDEDMLFPGENAGESGQNVVALYCPVGSESAIQEVSAVDKVVAREAVDLKTVEPHAVSSRTTEPSSTEENRIMDVLSRTTELPSIRKETKIEQEISPDKAVITAPSAFAGPEMPGVALEDDEASMNSESVPVWSEDERGFSPTRRFFSLEQNVALRGDAAQDEGEVPADEKDSSFLTRATVSKAADEQTVKVAAEKSLPVNKFPGVLSRNEGEGAVPGENALEGQEKSSDTLIAGKGIPPVEKDEKNTLLHKDKGWNDASAFRGKEDEDSASSLISRASHGRSDGRPSVASFSENLSRELSLGGGRSAALEDGMNNVVRFMRVEGQHKASIVVEPPALGRVEIELATTAGGVEASIRVGNEQLRQLVQDQITVLRTHLQQQGVQVAECTVDIRDSGKGDSGGSTSSGKKKGNSFVGKKEETEEAIPSFRVDLEQGLLYWVA